MRMLALALVTLTAIPAAAQTNTPIGAAAAFCTQVEKAPDGRWALRGPVTMDVGNCKRMTFQTMVLAPRSMNICGLDLFDFIEQTCGKK